MDFLRIWSHLAPSSRSWLIEHNGEPLPDTHWTGPRDCGWRTERALVDWTLGGRADAAH